MRRAREELARLITLESGLCLKDSQYEVGRASDVLLFAANQALVDDGEVFSCDLTAHGKSRKVYTLREPLLGVITAITPFNHPLNQVIHKVAPAVATNNRVVLKPSEKTPLTALALADILYEAGLPPEMLSVLTGDPAEIADELLTQRGRRPRHLHRRRVDRQVHRRQGRLQAPGAGARRQRSASSCSRTRTSRRRPRSRRAGPTRTPASAAPPSSACWFRRASPTASSNCCVEKTRAVKYGDPFDPDDGHGHGDRRGRRRGDSRRS